MLLCSNHKLQMYQHICAAAFGWLQGIHELKQKLEAAADNRHFKKLSHSIIDKCRWIYWLSCFIHVHLWCWIKVINLNDLLFLLTLKALSCYYCVFAGIIKFVIVDKICKVTAKQQTLQVILCQLSQIFIKKHYMWKEETMNYLKIRAVFEIFKLVFTDKKMSSNKL